MYFLAVLTFELIKHTNGFNDIPRVGKNLNDVILHGAHHTEPWLMTCNRKQWITLTYSEFDIDHIIHVQYYQVRQVGYYSCFKGIFWTYMKSIHICKMCANQQFTAVIEMHSVE